MQLRLSLITDPRYRKQTLDVESETAAEGAFKKMGYVEVGRIPKYSLNPAGQLRPQTFFYKDLSL